MLGFLATICGVESTAPARALDVTLQPAEPCVPSGTLDMMFVMDASGSISAKEFQQMASFVKKVMISFPLGPNAARAGIVVYASSSSEYFGLNVHTNTASFAAAVDKTPKSGALHCLDVCKQSGANGLILTPGQ